MSLLLINIQKHSHYDHRDDVEDSGKNDDYKSGSGSGIPPRNVELRAALVQPSKHLMMMLMVLIVLMMLMLLMTLMMLMVIKC